MVPQPQHVEAFNRFLQTLVVGGLHDPKARRECADMLDLADCIEVGCGLQPRHAAALRSALATVQFRGLHDRAARKQLRHLLELVEGLMEPASAPAPCDPAPPVSCDPCTSAPVPCDPPPPVPCDPCTSAPEPSGYNSGGI